MTLHEFVKAAAWCIALVGFVYAWYVGWKLQKIATNHLHRFFVATQKHESSKVHVKRGTA